MAVIKIQHIAFLLFISGLAVVNGGMAACTVDQVEVCGKKLDGVDESTLCDGPLDDAQDCWDVLFGTCEGSDDQKATKVQAVEKIQESQKACPTTTCSDKKVKMCKDQWGIVEGQTNFCRAYESLGDCFKNLTVNCLNETVKGELEKDIMDKKKNFTDQKCCSVMDLTKCGEDRVVITNSTADKDNCQKVKAGKACLEKISCAEAEMVKSIDDGLKEIDGFMAICQAAGYKMGDGGDSGNAIQPTLVLLLSAFVCALYGLYV